MNASWFAVLAVAAGSYALRLLPLLLAGRLHWPEPVDRALQHAGRAALVYLVVAGVLGVAAAGLLTALVLGLRGKRVAAIMFGGLAACLLVTWLLGLL